MISATGCRRARAGTGPCTKCSCSRFQGRGSVCENCKHHYNEHNIAWPRGLDRPGTSLRLRIKITHSVSQIDLSPAIAARPCRAGAPGAA